MDDDDAVRESLERTFTFEGYDVRTAADGERALAAIDEQNPHVVVLDLRMPTIDGLEVCRRLRSSGNTVPVLILTARDGTSDLVTGFNVGADDYLAKPFALEELLVRVRSLARRGRPVAGDQPSEVLRFANVTMNLGSRETTRADRLIELTRTEFELLKLFLQHPKQVLVRSTILREVWDADYDTGTNTLEVFIGYLRRKLEEDGEPRILQNVRGVGYVLRQEGP